MCIWRLKKLPFGVNCSPFILSAVLRFHLDSAFESASAAERDIIELLLRSFYVDDCVSSLPCCADAEKLQEYSVNVLQGAGMELRKWRGNTMTSDPEAGSKALGIVWNTESDCISVAALGDVECPKEVSGWSRRALLRCVAAVFDPLGWASPAVVPGQDDVARELEARRWLGMTHSLLIWLSDVLHGGESSQQRFLPLKSPDGSGVLHMLLSHVACILRCIREGLWLFVSMLCPV